jgi:hypothetical protein
MSSQGPHPSKWEWASIVIAFLVIAALAWLLVTPKDVFGATREDMDASSASAAQAMEDFTPFHLGLLAGYTRIGQEGRDIQVTTRVAGVAGKKARYVSITTVIELRTNATEKWSKFFHLNTKKKFPGNHREAFWVKSGTKKGSKLASGFEWRVRVHSVYRNGKRTHSKWVIRDLLPT